MQAKPAPVGKRFGAAVVLGEGTPQPAKGRVRRQWRLRCDCGREFEKVVGAVNAGRVKDCGVCANARRCKHGGGRVGRQHPDYFVWCGLRRRCNSPAAKEYPYYGGRGIRVCARWDSFENFIADMGPRPTPQHSLDRIDNNGNYEPVNCRWATSKEQGRNKRNNRKLTFRGKTLCLTEWAEELNMPVGIIQSRLHAQHDVETVLGTDVLPGQVLDQDKDRRVAGSFVDYIRNHLRDGDTSAALAERLHVDVGRVRDALLRLRYRRLAEMSRDRTWRKCG